MPRRQPRKPSIGLNSCSSSTRCVDLLGRDAELLRQLRLLLLACAAGTRAAADRGSGSSPGSPSAPGRCRRSRRAGTAAAWRAPPCASSSVSARIISRIASMRSPSKNMCSVRHRPMPSAPNAIGVARSARACRRWCGRSCAVACAHHFISCCEALELLGLLRGFVVLSIRPATISRRRGRRPGRRRPRRRCRRSRCQSPSLNVWPPTVTVRACVVDLAAPRRRRRRPCPSAGRRARRATTRRRAR